MIKALWLTSWYPNRQDPYHGDFIQRHAKAAAAFIQIDVLHVEYVNPPKQKKSSFDRKKNVSLNETIFYPSYPQFFFPKFRRQIKYFFFFRKKIRQHLSQYGKPDIIHVHVLMRSGLLALYLQRKLNIPFVVTEHWGIYNDAAYRSYDHRHFLFRYFTKKIFRKAAAFCPVSEYLGNAVNEKVIAKDFCVIENVVDSHLFRRTNNNDKHVFTFLHASSMNHAKNVEAIINCFKIFHQVYSQSELVLAGYADEKLIRLADQHPAIVLKGMISYAEVARVMQAADAFILFSHYENAPCVIAEALCCGLPVIASDVGGISEMIDDSNGMLVKAGNAVALLKAMTAMYINHKTYNREKISEAAIQRYNFQTIGKKIHNVYQQVLKNSE